MPRMTQICALGLLLLQTASASTAFDTRHSPIEAENFQDLQARAGSCPTSNPVSCSAVDSKLPGNFCCSSGTSCISLDSSSSAICCPGKGDCGKIRPITCNVTLQNPSRSGPVFTTKLQDNLPTCAGQCCPFGYSCSGPGSDALCILNQNTAIVPNNSSAAAATSTTTQASSSSSATSTANPTSTSVNSIDSHNPPPNATTNKFPAGVFMAGFFPGIVIGVLMTLAWVVLTGRHAKPSSRAGSVRSPGTMSAPSFGKPENESGYGAGSRPWISRPMMSSHQSNDRSDFLSRTRSRARSIFSLRRGDNSRTVDSVDMWNSKMPTPPAQNNVPKNFLSSMNDVPVTPARRVARYSEESQSQRETPYDMYPQHDGASRPTSTFASGALPAVAPLRGMQNQRQRPASGVSIERRDSGIGTSHGTDGDISGFGSPFQTPNKKGFPAQEGTGLTNLKNKTFHDITTLENGSPINRNDLSHNDQGLPFLSPATYTPEPPKNNNNKTNAPAAAALPARPPIPIVRPARPDTEFDDSDGVSFQFDNPPPASMQKKQHPAAAGSSSYNPHLLHSHTLHPNSHNVTCDAEHDPHERDLSNKSKHTTNATTFTTMLRQAGIPDPGNQVKNVPSVPKVPKGYL